MSIKRKFTTKDQNCNECMLRGSFKTQGYDWWWHSFTAINRRTGAEKPFFIEFFVCNPALAEDEPVLGQLPANQTLNKKPSYLMVNCGCWGADKKKQLHRFFAWKDVKIHMNAPYSVQAADCYADEYTLRGTVALTEEEVAAHPEYMCDAGTMTFDIKVDKQIAWNVGYGTSWLMRRLNAFEMYWHAEGMKTLYSGTIVLDGDIYDVIPEKSYGYADKNWGSDFTTPWVWLSSCDLTSNITGKKLTNSVFDIGGGAPKAFGIRFPRKLLGGFCYEGDCYEFNFSKLWTFSRTSFDGYETDDEVVWHVDQKTIKGRLITDIRCKKDDMLNIHYEAPNGKARHQRLWNCGKGYGDLKLYKKTLFGYKLIDDMHAEHIGCEYGEYDHPEPYIQK